MLFIVIVFQPSPQIQVEKWPLTSQVLDTRSYKSMLVIKPVTFAPLGTFVNRKTQLAPRYNRQIFFKNIGNIMSIYMQLASSESYMKSLTNELPNSATVYDEKAFLERFQENIKAEKVAGVVSPLMTVGTSK